MDPVGTVDPADGILDPKKLGSVFKQNLPRSHRKIADVLVADALPAKSLFFRRVLRTVLYSRRVFCFHPFHS